MSDVDIAFCAIGLGSFGLGFVVNWALNETQIWRKMIATGQSIRAMREAEAATKEAQRQKKVMDELPDYDPRKSWGAEIHNRWEELKIERDTYKRDADMWRGEANYYRDLNNPSVSDFV